MKPAAVGGQAVIEGVMMKAPERLCVAVRRPDGQILVKNDPFNGLARRWPALGWPFLRGPVILGETLVLGMKALSFSAQQAMEDEGEPVSPWAMALTMLVAVVVGVGLFVALPHLAALWLGRLSATGFDETSLWFHLIDGVIKVGLFLAYIWAIALMPDIKRVFEYHGAEHKAIYCYESGGELTVEAARGYPRLHPRCGTAFILVVLVVSIFFFAALFPLLPRLAEAAWLNQALQILLKVGLMLPIAGLSYEIIRRAGDRGARGVWGALLWPGLQLQRMTTREPDDRQIEIALCALKAAVATDRAEKSSITVL
ncbi:protein of unknown function DUF1385 [Desulfarculus baarsii DSM 2075]|uniref:DUF1385 domain-containing protein n=1 Tax=Desulfarculus baarsii (strain ATCC 33931 / DSM 2075 / LMG 7858 / VKM B-1802 / 2st14) TaxID=644282 RepID=E1QEX2_DESB2|nr:DUF1385 domain-containing protein [Desulfarculus baarsii]ADK84108.1 protein of unknown function DUF1385 [Desulfarculus baarsii DSM 2075]